MFKKNLKKISIMVLFMFLCFFRFWSLKYDMVLRKLVTVILDHGGRRGAFNLLQSSLATAGGFIRSISGPHLTVKTVYEEDASIN